MSVFLINLTWHVSSDINTTCYKALKLAWLLSMSAIGKAKLPDLILTITWTYFGHRLIEIGIFESIISILTRLPLGHMPLSNAIFDFVPLLHIYNMIFFLAYFKDADVKQMICTLLSWKWTAHHWNRIETIVLKEARIKCVCWCVV